MKYLCNSINVNYRYQFNENGIAKGKVTSVPI